MLLPPFDFRKSCCVSVKLVIYLVQQYYIHYLLKTEEYQFYQTFMDA